mmetsp:Transcript_76472/g.236804  ORF Transcript_76472/g.236804 Transcript_76472/m.236804 type:complete len:215 (+) Transcript_76472:208-852(+)
MHQQVRLAVRPCGPQRQRAGRDRGSATGPLGCSQRPARRWCSPSRGLPSGGRRTSWKQPWTTRRSPASSQSRRGSRPRRGCCGPSLAPVAAPGVPSPPRTTRSSPRWLRSCLRRRCRRGWARDRPRWPAAPTTPPSRPPSPRRRRRSRRPARWRLQSRGVQSQWPGRGRCALHARRNLQMHASSPADTSTFAWLVPVGSIPTDALCAVWRSTPL